MAGFYCCSPSFIDVRILHVVDFHSPDVNGVCQDRFVTLRISNHSSTTAIFSENQYVQTRTGRHWLEPAKISRLNEAVLRPSTDRDDFVLRFPPHAEACRLLLEYREGNERVCRLQAFFMKYGLDRRFPTFCNCALQYFAGQPCLRHVDFELRLPPDS